ncbi:ArnT 4-amino-4-deoxy-L-arabinose transferase and related glycosyltransferases of PMT family [Candidatus Pelagibacterales bacterium]|jgi:4-amino-4-deoxy-L-arabinose transferase-like glycosyltransferase
MIQPGKEKKIFYLLCLYHLIIWTLVPYFSNKNLPLDVIEALAWGQDFDLGYNKHPPLSAWIPGLLFKIFGNKDWVYYLLSQIFIVISFVFLWKLSSFFLKKKSQILLSVLTIEGIAFYTFETPQFNVNICQIPLWIGTIYFFLKSIKNNKIADWIFLGIFSALGFLTKYIFVYLLISLFFYLIYIFFIRKKINFNFLYTVLIFFLITAPHFQWLLQNDFTTIYYALKRGGLNEFNIYNHLLNPFKFLINQISILLPFLLLIYLLIKKIKIKLPFDNQKFIFLLFSFLLPFFLILITSMVTGSRIRTMWMIPFYSLIGVFFIFLYQDSINLKKLKSFNILLIIFLIISPTLYSLRSIYNDSRTGYEGKKIALQIEKEWKTISKDEISNVGFSEWYAGNLSYHLSNRPKVFLEENNNFYKKSAVIVAKDIGPSLCNLKKKINVKNIVYKKIDNHDVCFIF